ncbi:hypothetical protein L2E82_35742 [Cichorium intybus]|uniref:Uncharacterized protein n=1 Tax=Cichorium intybus TaxID=13427 RepID=A0ACB9BPQ1_CICIN|nr:hypothetical protein L2E82_35742 [Cichorium intybus]
MVSPGRFHLPQLGHTPGNPNQVLRLFFQKDLIESLGVYIVAFDRPGYGESDRDPNQTLKSFALDVEELADQLGLGSKFYLIGYSQGGQMVWPCLKYIPHRLLVAFVSFKLIE